MIPRAVVAALFAFLLASPAMVVYTSFQPSLALGTPQAATLRWYARALAEPRFVMALETSTIVALAATVTALLVGVPASVGLVRGRVPAARLVLALLLSPLTLPGLVLAMGLLMFLVAVVQPLTGASWVGTTMALVVAHVAVTVPWVVRTVVASLSSLDPTLEDAARGLGATPVAAFFLVTLPAIRSGIVAAAIFAFVVSFGNFALSLFFTGGRVVTLPIAIFEYVDRFQDPTIAALSTIMILLTTGLVALAGWLTRGGGAGAW